MNMFLILSLKNFVILKVSLRDGLYFFFLMVIIVCFVMLRVFVSFFWVRFFFFFSLWRWFFIYIICLYQCWEIRSMNVFMIRGMRSIVVVLVFLLLYFQRYLVKRRGLLGCRCFLCFWCLLFQFFCFLFFLYGNCSIS